MYAYAKAWVELNATKLKMDERAVTALEYALIAALIGVTIITGAQTLGNNISNTFTKVAGYM